MRTELNSGQTPSLSNNPMNVVVKTKKLSATRQIVPRKKTTARSATVVTPSANAPTRRVTRTKSSIARSATTTTNNATVARSGRTSNTTGTTQTTAPTRRILSRDNGNTRNRTANTNTLYVSTSGETLSSARCLADYTECMNGYCQREETAYNRCYCSARLSQIDATYQSQLDNLIYKLISLQTTNAWSTEEMNEYWMMTIGKYRGENSWTNLENALNIDWAGMESRVRGQQAFVTGHEYCIQHLRGCYYMASNLRDAYRSEISRDCDAYETSLQNIKDAAESLIENYND